jgi:alkylation response protein AidB-like acyl-CoA dehydrogenase
VDFSIAPKTLELSKTIRAFVREELIPIEPQFTGKEFKELVPLLAKKREQVKNLGLWAPFLHKEDGGLGLSLMDFGHISEALGYSPIGHYVFNCQAPDVGNMEVLLQHGTDEQKEKYLKPLMAGETRSCFSMTEPENPGSNPTLMDTTAVQDGDEWVINGHKWFTSAADGSAFAIVMAVTHPDAPPHGRTSQIIVPTNTPGFEHVRNISVMGEPGSDYNSHAEIRYTDCRVPLTNILGEGGSGFVIAQERLGPGRIHHCMRWIGICERAFDLMCKRAATRIISPGRTLGSKQTIQQWIAESRAEINAARLMVLEAAWSIDKDGTYATRDKISVIKFYVAGILQRILDRAIQTHGAMGITDDLILAWWYRHERGARIYDGPDEVHKASVAKRILKSYAEPVKS